MFSPGPFFTYIFLMAYTPGPNNIMSMNNAREKGLKKGFPFNLGILLGTSVVMILCTLAGSVLFTLIPQIKLYMTIAGACYMLWLAVSLLKPSKEIKQNDRLRQGFWAGALLQFVNPKLYIYGITAVSSYILPYFGDKIILLGFAILLAFVGFSSTVCWAVFGLWLSKLFRNHSQIINACMAVLLCYCAISLFF